jgi:hypothetical protein
MLTILFWGALTAKPHNLRTLRLDLQLPHAVKVTPKNTMETPNEKLILRDFRPVTRLEMVQNTVLHFGSQVSNWKNARTVRTASEITKMSMEHL